MADTPSPERAEAPALRDVDPGDLGVYLRIRCDPVMMADLGGPLPRAGMAEKVEADVRSVAEGRALIKMIIPDPGRPGEVAGSVSLWWDAEERRTEIGWTVLPEYQGRGLAERAAAQVLELARGQGRWGAVHAFPAVRNAASNGVCRSLGFTRLGRADIDFAGRTLHCEHWVLDGAPGR
ncbi:GNAT family N-acetyltransferase [Nocardiopsis sp. CNT-189]|uniref:GNAT family N-acetyltransferase n=1 Tax=Nocardiopsis oceanisediminis TaxID=2816862 RepID=UPI003B385E80